MLHKSFIFIAFWLLPILLAATPPQGALVHFDKAFYASGEVVWYKLYLPVSMQGKMFSVRASVFSAPLNLVGEAYIPVEKNGVCQGYFQVPFDARASMYSFVFAVMRPDGATDELIRAHVLVYSDLGEWPQKTSLETVSAPAFPPLQALKVEIVPAPESTFVPGGNVRLLIQVKDEIGHPMAAEASLSVTDAGLCGPEVLGTTGIYWNDHVPDAGEWLSGVFKSGFVKTPSGQLPSINLIPVLDTETQQLHFTKSAAGRFVVTLPPFEGERRLQIVSFPDEPFSVYWNETESPASTPPVRYTEGVLRYLETSRKRKKIYQLYGQTEISLQALPKKAEAPDWKGRQTFIVPNYEQFPDLATFFQEVVWRVKFVKKGERYSANMYNSDTHANFGAPPLFIIDRKATFDADYIGKLDQSLIAEIDMLSDPKQLKKRYPAIGNGGVVRIRSISGHLNLAEEKEREILKIQGVLPAVSFPLFSPDNGLPRIRPVTCWQPSFQTDREGKAAITFVQGDDRSTFCAEVVVQAPDGRRGYVRYCYEIN
jgi:hypothetical protein